MGLEQGVDDEEKFGKRGDFFSLRIYGLQKLYNQNLKIAQITPIYEDSLKLLCLENSLRFTTIASHQCHKAMQLAKMWQILSISLGDLNNQKKTIWSTHPLGWGLALNVITQFEQKKDMQQVAMIAALILGKENEIYLQQQHKLQIKRKEEHLMEENRKFMKEAYDNLKQQQKKDQLDT